MRYAIPMLMIAHLGLFCIVLLSNRCSYFFQVFFPRTISLLFAHSMLSSHCCTDPHLLFVYFEQMELNASCIAAEPFTALERQQNHKPNIL
jgi:hypothetical protein